MPNDVTVTRQVLAEPDAGLTEHTWATLADGTPLVTAARRGKGMIVLFHVTGDTRWSDLPLSGTFVDMLKRIVALAGTTTSPKLRRARRRRRPRARRSRRAACSTASATFEPPPPTARPVPAGFTGRATADHPPGFYGPPEGLLAVNTLAAGDRLAPLDFAPLAMPPAKSIAAASRRTCAARSSSPRSRCSCSTALVVFARRRHLRGSCRAPRAPPRSWWRLRRSPSRTARAAAEDSPRGDVPRSALETKLAYVVTGDAEVDTISKSGLPGLTLFLAQRTALEAGDPIGLDIARDELAFFPLIYWPIVPGAAHAAAKRRSSASTPT